MQQELSKIHQYYSNFYHKLSEFIDGEILPETKHIGYEEVHLCIENILNKPQDGEVIELTQEVEKHLELLRKKELEILKTLH